MPLVPAHFNVDGQWCENGAREVNETGHCSAGCDHAEHYTNDGHPECDDPIEVERLMRSRRWPRE